MLPMGQRATEIFSAFRAHPEDPSRRRGRAPARSGPPPNRTVATGRPGAADAPASTPVRQGDEVVFARLDLAEILGIWRHARGRVVGVHRQAGGATVDVQFQGHDTLERYLPDLFRRVH